ncbi:hypothetical protein JCM6882_005273 [Rhodosporidiobolus microsporus]
MTDRQLLLTSPAPASSQSLSPGQHSARRANPLSLPPSRFQRFRRRLAAALDSPETHWTIIGLSVLDFVFTVGELAYEFLKESSCVCNDSCEEPAMLEMVGWLSTFVTTAFVVEIPLDLVAFGPKHYLTAKHHLLHLFDAVVVIVAFVLEVLLQGPAHDVASLLIILRLWRLLKLVSALQVGSTELEEESAEAKAQKGWMEERERMLGEILSLRRRLKRYEAPDSGSEGSI